MTHFKLSEFEHSATAIALHIDNEIPENILPNIYNLVDNLLDPLREIIGEPIYINSGYRSDKLNKAVGGAKTSQHRVGCAADITTRRNSSDANERALNKHLAEVIKESFVFDQLIYYNENSYGPKFLHVSLRPEGYGKNRGQVLHKRT